MEDHNFALHAAEHEHSAIAKMRSFNCLFQGHSAYSDRFIGTHQVHISRLGYLREFVHSHRNGRLLAQSDSRLQEFRLRFPSIPFLLLMPFLAAPARLVFDSLSLEMLERLINRRNHVPSLS